MPPADLYDYHRKNKYPSHGTAVMGILVVFGIYIITGIYAILKLWSQYGTMIMSFIHSVGIPEILNSNLITISVIIGAYLFFSILLAIAAASIAKRLGGTLILIGAAMTNILTWAPVFLLLYVSGWDFSILTSMWMLLIPGVATLIITILMFTVFKDRVIRAGRIISLTGEVCLKHKSVFAPPFVSMIFTFLSSLIFGAIVLEFLYPNGIVNDPVVTGEATAIIVINFLIYLFITIFVFKFAYATTSAITYLYIRGRKPSLNDGVKGALGTVAGLAALAVMSVIVTIIQMIIRAISRRSGPAGGRTGDTAARAVGWIWALINYFTVPAMVAENLGATAGIKKSFNLVRKNFVDIVIKETGVRWGFSALIFMLLLGFGAGGAFVGWLQTQDFMIAFLYGIIFLILAGLPTTLILRTFDIVYITILYVFIRMKDGSISKTAIPGPAKKTFETAYRSARRQ
ncbi:MAG: DUF6159 family protein [Candidatus Thorarchaeota archaeon]|nr:DUF6159 family protein [Candidatus Thorarchaeota archaeon]